MKQFVLIALVLMISLPALADNDWCLTPTPQVDSLAVRSVDYPYPHEMSTAVIRFYAHRLFRTDGSGGITEAQLDEQLEWLYDGFAQYNIHFVEAARDTFHISFYDSALVFVGGGIFDFMDNHNHTDGIDIFVTEGIHNVNLGGAREVPATSLFLSGNRMFNEVIVHEVGHCLDLYHTFETQFGVENPDESNCDVAGDLICDTAACPTGGIYEPLTDPDTCTLTSLFHLVYPDYDPDPHNYMVYAPIHCFDNFTDEQLARVFASLENIPILQAVLVDSAVRFANYSGDTGLDYTGVPRSSVGFDYNYDPQAQRNLEDLMITIADSAVYSALYEATGLSENNIPEFDRVTTEAFAVNRPLVGLGGVSVADMDNDGDLDLFCASGTSETPHLYGNDGDASFTDVTETLGLDEAATNSWAGAWADYDRDGWVDLMLIRGGEPEVDPDEIGAEESLLMRNDLDPVLGSGVFEDVTSAAGMTTSGANAAAALAGCWGDINGDGRADLYIADSWQTVGAHGRLFVQQTDGTFLEQSSSRLPTGSLLFQTAATFADMDNDGDFDLVVGQNSDDQGAWQTGATVYFNNGSGYFTSESPVTVPNFGGATGLKVWDHDLDMRPDILLTTKDSGQSSRFFHNLQTESGLALNDETHHVGLDDGFSAGGLTVLDWNRDGDKDVYLGRPVSTGKVFYRAEDDQSDDDLGTDFICLRLSSPQGVNNRAGIGAVVLVEIDNVLQCQVVDGGSGRGGQDDLALTFAVPGASGTYPVEIHWPNGWVQTAYVAVDDVGEDPQIIEDNTNPTVVNTSVAFSSSYDPNLQQTYWIFTWETEYRSDWSLDKVNVLSSSCGGAVEYTAGSGGVQQTIARLSTGKYQHSLTIPVNCSSPCTIPYTVTSAHRTGISSTSSQKSFRIQFCAQQ